MLKQPTLTTMTVRKICKGIDNEEIKFDNPVQRGFVWDAELCSDLVHTLFVGAPPVPPIYAEKSNEGKTKSRDIYDVLDGQQRCTALHNFVNDQFALVNFPTIAIDDTEYELEGMKFSECPEEVQNAVLDYSMYVFVMSDLTQNEKTIVFRKLNAGKDLSTKAKNVAFCGDLDAVTELAKHPLFEKMLTPTGFKSKTYVGIIMKMYAILHAERDVNDKLELSFESKVMNKMFKDIKFSDNDKAELKSIMDYANEVLSYGLDMKKTRDENIKKEKDKSGAACLRMKSERKKFNDLYNWFKKETHMVSFFPYLKGFMDMDLPADAFWDFITAFNAENPRDYNEAAKSDSSKTKAINDRDFAIANFLEIFLENIEMYADDSSFEEELDEAV